MLSGSFLSWASSVNRVCPSERQLHLEFINGGRQFIPFFLTYNRWGSRADLSVGGPPTGGVRLQSGDQKRR